MAHSHCACRDIPETISMMFNGFDSLVSRVSPETRDFTNIDDFFGCNRLDPYPKFPVTDEYHNLPSASTTKGVNCDTDSEESEFLCEQNRNTVIESEILKDTQVVKTMNFFPDDTETLKTNMMTCLPLDIISKVACAQTRPELWPEIKQMMALAYDCFDHTPFTGIGGPSAEEVLHAEKSGVYIPFPDQNGRRSFARQSCLIPQLPPFCIKGSAISLFLPSNSVSGQKSTVWLSHCADSYGEYRRAHVNRYKIREESDSTKPPLSFSPSSKRRAVVVRISQSSTENLWHAAHVLAPLAVDLQPDDDLILDCAQMDVVDEPDKETSNAEQKIKPMPCNADSQIMREFLPVLSKRPVQWISAEFQQERCYDAGSQWGVQHLTLFGRDKGSWRGIQTAFTNKVRKAWGDIVPSKKPKLVFALRTEADTRQILNLDQVTALLDEFRDQFEIHIVDLSKLSIQNQFSLVNHALLIGAHGQALSWLMFAAACIEIMPHMTSLWTELCRPGWDQTPMYAYGGMALVFKVAHLCVMGEPIQGYKSGMGQELNNWIRRNIWVDIENLRKSINEATHRMS